MTRSRAFDILLKSAFTLALTGALAPAQAAGDCIPEGVKTGTPPAEMPGLFPGSMPMPSDYHLLNASAGAADEYDPFRFATVEFIAPGDREGLFELYEKSLPAAGYRIVMWEKDEGAMGFRVKGEGIDQATIALSDYDCRAYAMISASLTP